MEKMSTTKDTRKYTREGVHNSRKFLGKAIVYVFCLFVNVCYYNRGFYLWMSFCFITYGKEEKEKGEKKKEIKNKYT
jgi:hypothetical protein